MRRQIEPAEESADAKFAGGAILPAMAAVVLTGLFSFSPRAFGGDPILDELLRDRRIQTQLPDEKLANDRSAGAASASNERESGKGESSPPRFGSRRVDSTDEPETHGDSQWFSWLSSLGGFAAVVVKILIGVCALAVVYFVVERLRMGRGSQAAARIPRATRREPRRTVESVALEAPGDAAELAREGRYAEAIHALLLALLANLSSERSIVIPASWTSRELVTRLGFDPTVRSGFERLVSAVERGVFGELEIDRVEYETCREIFDALAMKGRAE